MHCCLSPVVWISGADWLMEINIRWSWISVSAFKPPQKKRHDETPSLKELQSKLQRWETCRESDVSVVSGRLWRTFSPQQIFLRSFKFGFFPLMLNVKYARSRWMKTVFVSRGRHRCEWSPSRLPDAAWKQMMSACWQTPAESSPLTPDIIMFSPHNWKPLRSISTPQHVAPWFCKTMTNTVCQHINVSRLNTARCYHVQLKEVFIKMKWMQRDVWPAPGNTLGLNWSGWHE